MRRIQGDLLLRTKKFAHRVLDVAEAIDQSSAKWRVRGRVIDQLVGSGTSVGANTREADEAMSVADFAKALAIALKELSECTYWLEIIAERDWLPAKRLSSLLTEAIELTKILNVVIAKTRRSSR